MPDLNTEVMIPSGLRRFTLTMLSVRDEADRFQGVPRGTGKPFRYLAAFQEAEPYLGLPPQAYKLLAWLIKQTMAHDWEEGSRPICWPSAARQEEFLALSPARVKVFNRALFEAGIFILRDSETGKRYGRRDPEGRIIEAYGFDLSPLAYHPRGRLRSEGKGEDLKGSVDFKSFGRVEELHPGELLELAPRLAAHVNQRYPDWNDIVDAGGNDLRPELGVSESLWREACGNVGRQMAVVILAVVSTKPEAHFTRGAGGYFAAMIKRARTGELHLDRSLWKLRRDHWSRRAMPSQKPVPPPVRPWA